MRTINFNGSDPRSGRGWVGLVVFSVFAIGFRVVGVDSGGASRPQSSSEAIRGAGQPEGGGGLSRVVSRPITFAREDGVAGCCGAVQHLSRPVSFLAAEAPEGTGSATLDGPYAKYLRVPALTSDLVSWQESCATTRGILWLARAFVSRKAAWLWVRPPAGKTAAMIFPRYRGSSIVFRSRGPALRTRPASSC